jgi:hypothetical protein
MGRPGGCPKKSNAGSTDGAVAQLETQRDQVARAMQIPPQNKRPALIRNMDQYSKLNDLINRLQSGQPVAPDETDLALQPTLR